MTSRKREGNRPDWRLSAGGAISPASVLELKSRTRYVGSANHKLRCGDYGFTPSHNPRPLKSPCDELRAISLDEAAALFERGIELGMTSAFGLERAPKYVWSVDGDGEVYEAKARPERENQYHGYRLGDGERAMRGYIVKEWNVRCSKS